MKQHDTNLIVLCSKRHEADFRMYLMRAAAAANVMAVHLCCQADTILTTDQQVINTYPMGTESHSICSDLVKKMGQKMTYILVGLILDPTRIALVEQLREAFQNVKIFYDAYDYFRYGSEGQLFERLQTLDKIWQKLCDTTLILQKGLVWNYPRSHHFDNASHLRLLPGMLRVEPHCLVYIGSIDRRVDFEWLNNILRHDVVLDIYGAVFDAEIEADSQLKDLLRQHKNVTYHGAYTNDELQSILSKYRVGLVPYKTNYTMTDYVNPDKIYHYLNAGLDVISTPIPQAKAMTSSLYVSPTGADLPQILSEIQGASRGATWSSDQYTWEMRWQELQSF
jgi:hypothetical protein